MSDVYQYDFDAIFPQKIGNDLRTYLQIALEKYRKRFPMVKYKSLLLPVQAFSGGVSTDTTKTVVDDLYGEDVPEQLAGNWQQPHTLPGAEVTETGTYGPLVDLNMNIEYVRKDRNLTKTGIDVTQRPYFVFLDFQLRIVGISIKEGDRFIWKDHQYEIQHFELRGRWFNTDYFLYIAAEASLVQQGS